MMGLISDFMQDIFAAIAHIGQDTGP
jgi:hypothetical protein